MSGRLIAFARIEIGVKAFRECCVRPLDCFARTAIDAKIFASVVLDGLFVFAHMEIGAHAVAVLGAYTVHSICCGSRQRDNEGLPEQ